MEILGTTFPVSWTNLGTTTTQKSESIHGALEIASRVATTAMSLILLDSKGVSSPSTISIIKAFLISGAAESVSPLINYGEKHFNLSFMRSVSSSLPDCVNDHLLSVKTEFAEIFKQNALVSSALDMAHRSVCYLRNV